MIDIVENFLKKYNLNFSDKTFLVGFSGGYDSLCLLDILHNLSYKYKFKLIALHLNHNWRGEESSQDEVNCRNFCKERSIEFVSEILSSDILKTENSAREARYDFFVKYAEKYLNSEIFTAHTLSDNAETVLYRIVKGTGIVGLQGILPLRKINSYNVYRPLLSFSRNQIEDYCNSKGLVPNSDSSNFDINFKRNFIRHKIMPLFDEINFHAEKSINSLSKLAVSQTNIVNEYICLILKNIYIDKKIYTSKFVELSEDVMRKIIYDGCLKYGLDYDYKKINNILEFIINNSKSKAGSRYSLTKKLWLFVNNKYIYVIDNIKGDVCDTEIKINSEGQWQFSSEALFSLEKYNGNQIDNFPKENAKIAYVNLNFVGLDLTIRTRREGDYIIPFGMHGKMKLKKYLNSKGVLQHEKNELILLCKDSEVLWVAGVGLSNKLKVVDIPTHVLKLDNIE